MSAVIPPSSRTTTWRSDSAERAVLEPPDERGDRPRRHLGALAEVLAPPGRRWRSRSPRSRLPRRPSRTARRTVVLPAPGDAEDEIEPVACREQAERHLALAGGERSTESRSRATPRRPAAASSGTCRRPRRRQARSASSAMRDSSASTQRAAHTSSLLPVTSGRRIASAWPSTAVTASSSRRDGQAVQVRG